MTDPSELPTGFLPEDGRRVDYMEREFPDIAFGGPQDIESLTVALAPLMRRARDLRRTMAANEAAYKKEIEAITMQHAAVQGAEQAKLDYLEREIERLGRMRLEYEGDRKSVILLHGQIGTRRQPTTVQIEDVTALGKWFEEHDLAVPYNKGPTPPPPTVDKKKLLALAIEKNTEFPGMKLVLGEDRFFFDDKVVDDAEPV